jgi:hypothetical protein
VNGSKNVAEIILDMHNKFWEMAKFKMVGFHKRKNKFECNTDNTMGLWANN